MAKVNVRETDPARYRMVKAEQDRLRREYGLTPKLIEPCPYCDHKTLVLYKGSHGAATAVCSRCGEEVFFPPVHFRLA